MSVNYAAGLSEYDDLGICGLKEIFEDWDNVKLKVATFADLLRQYNGSCVVHVGAGLSTAAGIPDFRGQKGVWTKLKQNTQSDGKIIPSEIKHENIAKDPEEKIKPFDETEPTKSHMALKTLCQSGYIGHIVSQNVDGLFLKSDLPRKFISELHGNFYLDECTRCHYRYIRDTASQSMRLQKSNRRCPRGIEVCKGFLRDTILDWESPIPYNELRVATRESKRCKLHICIGTSLQLRPSKELVAKTKNKGNKLVIINLQPTLFDKHADIVINYYADDVMEELTRRLDLKIPDYDPEEDPTKKSSTIGSSWDKK